jgi:CPA2 family monovalent cation:H+ antiporter-2
VIDLNMDSVRALRDQGIDAIYGDATRVDALQEADLARAGILILGSAGLAGSAELIRMARELNPHIRVLARAPYLRDVPSLREAGATSVYSGEAEVALAFIEDILENLGATAEQIDRERDRAHQQLSRPDAAD